MTYTADHFRRDSMTKHLIPNIEKNKGVRPHGNFQVAEWLPVANSYYDKWTEDELPVMAGKILAMDRSGRVVPAGLKLLFKAAGTNSVVLKYEQRDIDRKVISLKSGNFVDATDLAANGGTGWTKGDLETALKARGDLRSVEALEDFISDPVAVAPYSFYQKASTTGDNLVPANLRFHNRMLQHQVAILCDYVIELPLVPEVAANKTITSLGTVAQEGTSAIFYLPFLSSSAYFPIAADTFSTPWSFASDTKGLFKNKVDSKRGLRVQGDYLVAEDENRLYFVHSSKTLNTAQTDSANVAVTFYHYNSASDSHVTEPYAAVVGDVKPGDYLIPTVNSNWIKATKANSLFAPSTAAAGTYAAANIDTIAGELAAGVAENALVIGQVLEVYAPDTRALSLVRSYGGSLPQDQYLDRMPGSATDGRSDKLTYAKAAKKLVRINIIRK